MTTMIQQRKKHYFIMCFCGNLLVKTSSYQKHFALFPGMGSGVGEPDYWMNGDNVTALYTRGYLSGTATTHQVVKLGQTQQLL